MMSFRRSHDDIEEIEISDVQPHSDVHNASTVELLEHPSNVDFPQPGIGSNATTSQRAIGRGKQCIRVWSCIAADSFSDWWMGELLAVLISNVTLIAIVIILRKYDNRTLPKLTHNISLNFIVSTLATVSKSSLLLAVASAIGQFKWLWISANYHPLQDLQIFDEASRGPLGAFRLLASRLSLSWPSLGAIVTLLCLIFDPFIQGLISTSERVVYKDDSASLVNTIVDYPDVRNVSLAYDYRLVNAINDAVSTPNTLSETQPRCPTSNCTWPPFTSLGFCYDCQNVTRYMQNNSNSIDYQQSPDPDTYRNWTYTLPDMDGQGLTMMDGEPSFNITLGLDTETTPSFYMLPLHWTPMTGSNITSRIFLPSALLRVSPQFPDPGAISSAYVCSLSFCAHRRNVSVSLNQLSSTILQTVYGHQALSSSGKTLGLSFTGEDINMTYPSNFTKADEENGCTFRDWMGRLQALVINFNGYETLSQGFSSSNALVALNDSSNIPMAMNNAAIAMTNYFRDSSNTTIMGQAGRSEVYIRVNWPWITLPALLVAAGTAFLILAMLETERRGERVWKTSELALLFHGLGGGDSEQGFAAIMKVSEMERAAAGVRVRMANTAGRESNLRHEKALIKAI